MAADLGFASLAPVQPAPHASHLAATSPLRRADLSAGNSFHRSFGIVATALGARALTRHAQRLARRTQTARAVRRKEQATASNTFDAESVELTKEEIEQLDQGLPVQRQQVTGREGTGVVVLDVDAPWFVVLDSLRSFQEYPKMIPVIRDAEIQSRGCDEEGRHKVRADYKVSKFWLNISVMHTIDVAAKTVSFELHPHCGKLVLKEAVGRWTVTQAEEPGKSRVTLQVRLKASPLLPPWLIDYAASRALRRATSWLKPHVEHAWEEQAERYHVQDVAEKLPERQLHYLLA